MYQLRTVGKITRYVLFESGWQEDPEAPNRFLMNGFCFDLNVFVFWVHEKEELLLYNVDTMEILNKVYARFMKKKKRREDYLKSKKIKK